MIFFPFTRQVKFRGRYFELKVSDQVHSFSLEARNMIFDASTNLNSVYHRGLKKKAFGFFKILIG